MLFSNAVLAPAVASALLANSLQLTEGRRQTELMPFIGNPGPMSNTSDGRILQAGHWQWNGVEIYGTPFKLTRSPMSGEVQWFAGFSPVDKAIVDAMESAQHHALDRLQARSIFADFLRMGSWEIDLPQPIFQFSGNSPEAWWRMKLAPSGRIFWLRERDSFFAEQPAIQMGAQGTALVYRENKVASAGKGLEEIPLTDLVDSSYLRNQFFRVLNCLGLPQSFVKCGNYARSNSGHFQYPFESDEYSEMVGYYSVQEAMRWHRGIQSDKQKVYFENFALKGPIDIFVRADAANAPFYSPNSGKLDTTNPVIVVSTGMESDNLPGVLSFLSKDSDVFFHEFSHHVIYRSVEPTRAASQPRALQEGLADYFAYAITGNNKLGESTFGGVPLRQGNSESPFMTELFVPEFAWNPYDVGVIVSSIGWSLREKIGDWKNGYKRMDKIIWDSVDLLPKLATIYQFGCALVKQSESFEKSENIPAGQITSQVIKELANRQVFANEIPGANGCPAINDVLKAIDILEQQPSDLLLNETPRNAVVFTGEGRAALPPFGGSLYQPLQPRRVGCGSLTTSNPLTSTHSARVLSLILLFPLLFSGLRLRKSGQSPRRLQ